VTIRTRAHGSTAVAATVSPYGPKEHDNLIEPSRAARITASAF
jgi:hypothetical protein